MRPNLSDDVVQDLNRLVQQVAHVDPETLGVEQRLRILFANVGEIETDDGRGKPTDAGDVRKKYRSS